MPDRLEHHTHKVHYSHAGGILSACWVYILSVVGHSSRLLRLLVGRIPDLCPCRCLSVSRRENSCHDFWACRRGTRSDDAHEAHSHNPGRCHHRRSPPRGPDQAQIGCGEGGGRRTGFGCYLSSPCSCEYGDIWCRGICRDICRRSDQGLRTRVPIQIIS